MRSLPLIPGNAPRMLGKARGFRPDVYVPDLDDSVPDGEKEKARLITAAHVPKLAARGVPVIQRVCDSLRGDFG